VKIYTKTGDDGTTGLFGGGRVEKDGARVEAYGTVDELNAIIGTARAEKPDAALDSVLRGIQENLFVIGAELATASGNEGKLRMRLVGHDDVAGLERAIDEMETSLEPLRSFVLPGGTSEAAALHLARTVCRRAERRVLSARRSEPVRDEIVVYLNRLSDYLFVAARFANRGANVADVPWAPRSAP
jgi:cob(I)alamin adenosyltransferase